MTEKQKRFAEEYMKTGNSRQAYINAGYSSSVGSVDVNASRLLNSDKVQAYIKEISDQVKSEKIADIEEMQIKLTSIIRQLSVEEVIVTELIGHGESRARIIEKHPSLKEVLKACELLGKMLGCFTEKVKIEGTVPVVITGAEDLEE